MSMISNDPAVTSSLFAQMPLSAAPVDDAFLCPIVQDLNTCELEFYVKGTEKSKKKSKMDSCEKESKKDKSKCLEYRRRQLSKEKSIKVKSGSEKEPKLSVRVVGECTPEQTQTLMADYNQSLHMAKVEKKLNEKLDKSVLKIQKWGEYEKGNPEQIMGKLLRTCK